MSEMCIGINELSHAKRMCLHISFPGSFLRPLMSHTFVLSFVFCLFSDLKQISCSSRLAWWHRSTRRSVPSSTIIISCHPAVSRSASPSAWITWQPVASSFVREVNYLLFVCCICQKFVLEGLANHAIGEVDCRSTFDWLRRWWVKSFVVGPPLYLSKLPGLKCFHNFFVHNQHECCMILQEAMVHISSAKADFLSFLIPALSSRAGGMCLQFIFENSPFSFIFSAATTQR